jgi:hypothetical protein
MNSECQLLYEGTLRKQANIVASKATMFLFVHCLLLIKRRKPKDERGYVGYRQPIPLRTLLLSVEDESVLNTKKATPFLNMQSM